MARRQWDYISKFVIIGDPGVGKTSLLLRLTDDRFLSDTDPTIGVEFGAHTMTLTNGDRIKIQVWDTAGSETFRSLTRSYYRGAAGALLVYDVTYRRSYEHVAQWLEDLRAYADDGVSIVLIGNRTDVIAKEEEEEEEQRTTHSTHHSNPSITELTTPTTTSPQSTPAAAEAPAPSSEPTAPPAVATTTTFTTSTTAKTTPSLRRKKRQVPRAEAAAWAHEHGISFVETSAKTGDNVQEAFGCAAREIHARFLARATAPSSGGGSGGSGSGHGTIRPGLETTIAPPDAAIARGGGCC